MCEKSGIVETLSEKRNVGKGLDPEAIIREIVNDQAGRYSAFITNFSEGFQETGLEMYKWLIYAVLVTDIDTLETGLRRARISESIKAKHREGARLNEGNITQALQNAASLQVQKHIRPIIMDYDQTTRVLTIVDRSFLIWLAHQNRAELIQEIGVT